MIPLRTSLPYYGFLESRQGGRPENQDWMGFCDTWLGLLVVVCDGMGGGPGGKTASTVATQTIIDSVVASKGTDMSKKEALSNALEAANRKLLDMQQSNPSLRGMGTTVTALLINDMSATIVHMGDSRIYQLRFGHIQYRTTDHSQVMEMVTAGSYTEEDARNAPNSNIITRALGVTEDIEPEFSELPYEKGDRFVLCTDGIWNSMPENELIPLMAKTSTPNGAVEKTMIAVNEIGVSSNPYHDNFTMALIETKRNSILQEKMTHKTRTIFQILSAAIVVLLFLILFLFFSGRRKTKQANEYVSQIATILQERDEYKGQVVKLIEDTARLSSALNDMEEFSHISTDASSNTNLKITILGEDNLPEEKVVVDNPQNNEHTASEKANEQQIVPKDSGQVAPEKKNGDGAIKEEVPNETLQKLSECIDNIIDLFTDAGSKSELLDVTSKDINKMKKQLKDLNRMLNNSGFKDFDDNCKDILEQLNKPVSSGKEFAKGENRRKGQYDTLIKELKEIKKTIIEFYK